MAGALTSLWMPKPNWLNGYVTSLVAFNNSATGGTSGFVVSDSATTRYLSFPETACKSGMLLGATLARGVQIAADFDLMLFDKPPTPHADATALTLVSAATASPTTVAGSDRYTVQTSGLTIGQWNDVGWLTFTSGANNGLSRRVVTNTATVVTLDPLNPLPVPPVSGDTFTLFHPGDVGFLVGVIQFKTAQKTPGGGAAVDIYRGADFSNTVWTPFNYSGQLYGLLVARTAIALSTGLHVIRLSCDLTATAAS